VHLVDVIKEEYDNILHGMEDVKTYAKMQQILFFATSVEMRE
jgi:hypothetical protein